MLDLPEPIPVQLLECLEQNRRPVRRDLVVRHLLRPRAAQHSLLGQLDEELHRREHVGGVRENNSRKK